MNSEEYIKFAIKRYDAFKLLEDQEAALNMLKSKCSNTQSGKSAIEQQAKTIALFKDVLNA